MRFFRSSPIGTAAAILLIVAVVVAIFAGQCADSSRAASAGVSTRAERQARSSPRQSAEVLLERHVQACVALADSARENAAAQRTADRGSSRSRRKSPSTVMASALVASARPGSVASHHAVVR